jgi:hypothetical protein
VTNQVAESVFDEYDIEACSVDPEGEDEPLAVPNQEIIP